MLMGRQFDQTPSVAPEPYAGKTHSFFQQGLILDVLVEYWISCEQKTE